MSSPPPGDSLRHNACNFLRREKSSPPPGDSFRFVQGKRNIRVWLGIPYGGCPKYEVLFFICCATTIVNAARHAIPTCIDTRDILRTARFCGNSLVRTAI